MRRIAKYAVGIFALGLLFGSILEAQNARQQTPGTLLVRGEFITSTGCLAFLNNAQAQKKTGQCSFTVIAVGLKVPDFSCDSVVVTYEDPTTSATANDTVLNCTYSPVKTLPASPNTTPATKAGTVVLPESITQALSDGCLTYVNHPNLNCGFNVVLYGLAIPNMTLTTTISGGNTVVTGSYPPVLLTINPPPTPLQPVTP